tara:strand:- start:6726 stop:7484 length:759 start_codon:yes stop_codon:yes gene_type:complete
MKVLALGNPRTGTNYVLESLAIKHNLMNLGGFLHDNLDPLSVEYDEKNKKILSCSNQKILNTLEESFLASNKHCNILLETSTDWCAKIFIRDLKHISFQNSIKLFNNNDISKVLIYRSDLLDTALSYAIARKYKKFTVYNKNELSFKDKVVIDCKTDTDFLVCFKKVCRDFKLLREYASLFNWSTIYDYSTLTGDSFVDFQLKINPPCIKLFSKEEKLEKLKNFNLIEQEIKEFLNQENLSYNEYINTEKRK